MQTRIYVVLCGDEKRLVEASSAAQAIRHCVKDRYTAKVANTKELAQAMKEGLQVEQAGAESESNGTNANETKE